MSCRMSRMKENEWSGVEWSGVEWSGVEWSRAEKWSGVEWRSGMGCRMSRMM